MDHHCFVDLLQPVVVLAEPLNFSLIRGCVTVGAASDAAVDLSPSAGIICCAALELGGRLSFQGIVGSLLEGHGPAFSPRSRECSIAYLRHDEIYGAALIDGIGS